MGVATTGAGLPLTQAGLMNACQQLGVKAAEVWALVRTETDYPFAGFLANKKPQILFERHIFSKHSNGRFDQSNPDISNKVAGGYGASGTHQFDRFDEAAALDEAAAIQAASWGIGQTLGENYADIGYRTPQDFLQDMLLSEDNQLIASVREILANHLDSHLRNHDWANFARGYNGPGYARNHYDHVLAAHYATYSAGKIPDIMVRAAQIYLMYLDIDPSEVDGIFGSRTRAAMNTFQEGAGMRPTDSLDDQTFQALLQAARDA